MATACAVLAVVWLWYPRFRRVCVIAGLAVGAGLVGANYHFLGDVVAGAFLGASVGLMATAIWEVTAAPTFPRASGDSAVKD
jgi:membrane-associated phospholipid phosphatase